VRGATKERIEIELACTPESEIDALLSALGFVPTFAYEKYREAWALADHEVVLDETPLGCFVEIEGPDPETLLGALELTSARATAASYSELWAAHREENPEASRDMLWRPRSLPGAGSPQRQ
jgi:adenylate cyclase class 2